MKFTLTALLILAAAAALAVPGCSESAPPDGNHDPAATPAADVAATPLPEGIYGVGCYGCIFEQPDASGCATAVKLADGVHLVEGAGVPDAHSSGLCDGPKKAIVAGEIRDGVVHATKFEISD